MRRKTRTPNSSGLTGRTVLGGLPYHDREAEAALVKVEYGNIANMLAAHGYGPDKSVVTAKDALEHGGS